MIGIFDSGLGGLSALMPLKRHLPAADILYLADTAALPLGEKSDDEIRARIFSALAFFHARGADAVLLACGTASSLITDKCKERFTFPIFDIIQPTAKAIKDHFGGGRIALLCTEAAARAGTFAAALAHGDTPVYSLGCPALVHMAEGSAPKAPRAMAKALAPILPLRADLTVLGCTHFSLLSHEIGRALPHSRIVDAALCGAMQVAHHAPLPLGRRESGKTLFFTTGSPSPFDASASRVLGISVRAQQVFFS